MKRCVLAALALFVAFFALSCGKKNRLSSFDILCEVLSYAGENIGAEGSVYSSCAQEGELGYIPDALKRTLYEEKYVKEVLLMLEEYAVFLASNPVGEVAVFKCYSRSDTDSVAAMCLSRADAIKVALKNTELEKISEQICVEIHGRYVLFSFADCSEKIVERFCEIV